MNLLYHDNFFYHCIVGRMLFEFSPDPKASGLCKCNCIRVSSCHYDIPIGICEDIQIECHNIFEDIEFIYHNFVEI